MKTLIDRICIGVAILGNLLPLTASAQTTNLITGELMADAVWSGDYLLDGTVVVRSGVVLSIQPGTRLLMRPGASLRVEGQLLADGTETEPILFTRETAGTRWERILFVDAADSRLSHCVVEYADCSGDHKDYYDNDCDPDTPPLPRSYHEAVVVLASHLEVDHCEFRNLPDDTGSREGDAIAVISDDPTHPGPATAHIRHSRFISIGQGIHTRFAYVLVEFCYFTDHHGDNDDIDLYGESDPPAMIRYNLLLNPAHDDMINPTRCSAILIGNLIGGSDDHGVVLRDRCAPIMINNIIFDCASAGIAVQNQCDALLINNTIVNCGRGIRFFDHTGRWGPPYCLVPGSGQATIINSLIWDCPIPFELQNSPDVDFDSRATVLYSNVQGPGNSTVGSECTLTWGEGNIEANPMLADAANADFHLTAGSPCLDAGQDPRALAAALTEWLTQDFDGLPRPLDGDGDGTSAFDIGAYEFLLPTADSNGDGIPDGWCWNYGLDPTEAQLGGEDPDGDAHTTFAEWIADTNPTNALSFLRIDRVTTGGGATVEFQSSSNRLYTLQTTPEAAGNDGWTNVDGQVALPGNGGTDSLTDPAPASRQYYRIEVDLR